MWKNPDESKRYCGKAPVLLAGLMIVCGSWSCPAEDPCVTAVSSAQADAVTIASGPVQVVPGESFELRALVWGTDGSLLPEFLRDPTTGVVSWNNYATVTWSIVPPPGNTGRHVSPPVDLTANAPGSHRITVTALQPSRQTPPLAVVRAEVGGKSAERVIEVVVPDPILWGQAITSARGPKSAPTIALLDGSYPNFAPCTFRDEDLFFALAGKLGPLANVGRGCRGRFVIFNQDRRARLGFRPGGGPVTHPRLRPGGVLPIPGIIPNLIRSSPPPSDTLGMILWLPGVYADGTPVPAADRAMIESRVTDELAVANALMRENRTGLQFEAFDMQWTVISDWASLGAGDTTSGICGGVGPVLLALEPHLAQYKDHKLIHVVYFHGVGPLDVTGLEPAPIMGQSCPDIDEKWARVFVFLDGSVPTTLAHELGHQLLGGSHFTDGPLFPEAAICGDDEDEVGVAAHNLMASSFSGVLSSSRHHLTLGQAFRANFDQRSIVLDVWKYGPNGSSDLRSIGDVPYWCSNSGGDCPPNTLDPGWAP